MTDLVLLGAGHAHVEVLRRLALRPDRGLRLTLIAREPSTPYSGRLPALIRGECGPDAAHIDLGPLAAAADARLVIAEATSIDLAARRIAVRDRPAIRFDLLSIDIGGIPAMPGGAVSRRCRRRMVSRRSGMEAAACQCRRQAARARRRIAETFR